MESSYPSPSSMPADNHGFDFEDLVSELHALRNLYGLLQKNNHQTLTNHFLDEKSRDLLKKLLDGATLRALNSQAKIISGALETPKSLLNKPEQAEECRKYQPAAPPASGVAVTAKIFSPVEHQGITETPLPVSKDDDSIRRDLNSRPSGSQRRRNPSEPSRKSSRRVKDERDGSALADCRSCSKKGCQHLALVPAVPPASEVAAMAKIFSPVEEQGITETPLPVRKDVDSTRRDSISRPLGSQSRRKSSEPLKNTSRRVKDESGGPALALADRRSCSEKGCEHLALVPAVPPASEVAATAKIFSPVEERGITKTPLPVRKDDDSTRWDSTSRPLGSQSRRKPSEPSKNPSRRVKDESGGSALVLADRRSCSEKGGENQALVPAQKRARVDAPSRTRKGGRVDRELTHRKRASAAAMVKPSEPNRKSITSAGGQAAVVQQRDRSAECGSRDSKPEQKLLKQPEPASPRQMNRLPPNRSKARRFNSVSSSSATSTSPAESEPESSRTGSRVESRRAAALQCITSRGAINRREKALKRMSSHHLPSAALVPTRQPTMVNSTSSTTSTSPPKSKPATPRKQSRVKRRSAVTHSPKIHGREKALHRMPRDPLPSAALVPRRQPPSWQRRAAKAPKAEAEKEGTGRLRRFMKNKFDVIFHHHHHHYHHLHDGENENGGHGSSPWNYLKSVLHFRSGGRKLKGQHGYWHAMLEGLLRHIRGMRRRRAERRRLKKAAGGRRGSKKLRWWHWFRRRGGVALRSRRRLRLGFIRSSHRRTAAGKP